ncbi:hypothetical protein H310_04111 [Aphanomyces invadans]|uniref:Secreted protein n=1 Tax=Aphanomyces invadans TaxID=157072 RepID=A0A024UHJ4_9STRA|nr:hypothetical protein H310_04111 [Aphanomyces invadans]ETW05083.1 hypothetical protein H310_04111 [Aphanomyces invadans]|eukprot:XP_008866521.1 hypothetical protein H310_04111 [Aphanomyces invadans]
MGRLLVGFLVCASASGQSNTVTKVFRSDAPRNMSKESVVLPGNIPVDSRTSYSYERGSQETTTGQQKTGTGWSPYESVLGGSNVGGLRVDGVDEGATVPSDNMFGLQPPSPVGNVGFGGVGGNALGSVPGLGLMHAPGSLRGM